MKKYIRHSRESGNPERPDSSFRWNDGLLGILMMLAVAFPAQACETKAIDIKVNGLVCDFCARAVEKVMGKQEGITKVEVNLDQGMIHLQTTPQAKLDDAELTRLITDSGYSLVNIERKGC